jgi:hypothetical protein
MTTLQRYVRRHLLDFAARCKVLVTHFDVPRAAGVKVATGA